MQEQYCKPQVDRFHELQKFEQTISVTNDYATEVNTPERTIAEQELKTAISEIHDTFQRGEITYEQYLYFRNRYVPDFLDISLGRSPGEITLSLAGQMFIQVEAEADFLPPFSDDPSFVPAFGELVAGRFRILREQLPAIAVGKYLSDEETTYDDYMRFKQKILSTLLHQSLTGQPPGNKRAFNIFSDVVANWERAEASQLYSLDLKTQEETGFSFTFLYTVSHYSREGNLPELYAKLKFLQREKQMSVRRRSLFTPGKNREIAEAREKVQKRLPVLLDYIQKTIGKGFWDDELFKELLEDDIEFQILDGVNHNPDFPEQLYQGEHIPRGVDPIRTYRNN